MKSKFEGLPYTHIKDILNAYGANAASFTNAHKVKWLLADLMHFCLINGINFNQCFANAKVDFLKEVIDE